MPRDVCFQVRDRRTTADVCGNDFFVAAGPTLAAKIRIVFFGAIPPPRRGREGLGLQMGCASKLHSRVTFFAGFSRGGQALLPGARITRLVL